MNRRYGLFDVLKRRPKQVVPQAARPHVVRHRGYDALEIEEARRRVEALISEGKLIAVVEADNRPPHVVETFAPLLGELLTKYRSIDLEAFYWKIGWDNIEFGLNHSEMLEPVPGFILVGLDSDDGVLFVAPGDETIYDTYECLPNDPEATTYRSIYHFLLEVSETYA